MTAALDRLPNRWRAKIDVTFIDDCHVPGPCWVWTGAMNGPYGKVKNGCRTMQAHRAVYEFLIGPIATRLELDHRCENKECVNPDHLYALTRNDHRAVSCARRYTDRLAQSNHNCFMCGERMAMWYAIDGNEVCCDCHERRRVS